MINQPLLLSEDIDFSSISLRAMWDIHADSEYNVHWPQDRKLPLISNAIVAICTLHGSGIINLKNGKRIVVDAPSVVFIDSLKIRNYKTNGVVWDINWFEFVTHGFINTPLEHNIPIDLEDCSHILNDIKSMMNGNSSQLKAANAGFSYIFYKWLSLFETKDLISDQEKSVLDVVSMMNRHIGENTQIKEFAQAVGYTEQYLRKLFLKYLGCTPKKYYLKIKLDAGLTMLQRKGSSVKHVAYNLGFNDSFHFSRAFKAQFNYSPSEVEKEF
ncbi:AraC family transcriptional regulator [Vibrio alfacsensis]|uniref:helix-turn-helix transcriptional regulator n=1 Tax=Vibrio alfacsensis TaxID=1074311 RepID=UPI002ADD43F6|nr:AraC family transcriptional regulator [Vibrio alfacsensis]WQE77880.1 AraC family transcriptional regulator [Vibrio alfacsensis]